MKILTTRFDWVCVLQFQFQSVYLPTYLCILLGNGCHVSLSHVWVRHVAHHDMSAAVANFALGLLSKERMWIGWAGNNETKRLK